MQKNTNFDQHFKNFPFAEMNINTQYTQAHTIVMLCPPSKHLREGILNAFNFRQRREYYTSGTSFRCAIVFDAIEGCINLCGDVNLIISGIIRVVEVVNHVK